VSIKSSHYTCWTVIQQFVLFSFLHHSNSIQYLFRSIQFCHTTQPLCFIHATHTYQTIQFGVVKLSYSSWERGGEMVLWWVHVKPKAIMHRRLQSYSRRRDSCKGSWRWITKFLVLVKATGSLARCPVKGNRRSETLMRTNDESMAIQLHAILLSEGYSLSLTMILRCRKTPGRTFRGSEYCQMVREANKAKCLKWTMKYRHEADRPSRCDYYGWDLHRAQEPSSFLL